MGINYNSTRKFLSPVLSKSHDWHWKQVWFYPFKIIQGHRFWYQSKAHIYDFLLVINTNLPPILQREFTFAKIQQT